MYTYRWVSMLVWLYFTEGVVRAWGDKAPGNYCALGYRTCWHQNHLRVVVGE
jgi:uncharacterized membrane protein